MSTSTQATRLTALFGTDHPVAFVTGSGADRVGRGIARELAQAGYRVILHANTSVQEVTALSQQWNQLGWHTSYVTGRIDDPPCIDRWIDHILREYGALHVLVNSAAAWEPTSLESLNAQTLAHQWQVNLMGPTLLCRAAGLAMVGQSGGGTIVNIGDWAVVRPYCDFAAYLLSKGALRTMTEVMAVELAQRNPRIRVNAVLPGPVLLDQRISPAARDQIIQQALLKREGTVEDVAQAVKFLIESPFITGVSLPVDGGRSIFAGDSPDIVAHPTYQPDKLA